MLEDTLRWAVQKWLNRSRCCLVSGLGWAEWSGGDSALCQITLTTCSFLIRCSVAIFQMGSDRWFSLRIQCYKSNFWKCEQNFFLLYSTSCELCLLFKQVVKVIWNKSASPTADVRFNRIRQVAPMCLPMRAHWRHLANMIELVHNGATWRIRLNLCFLRPTRVHNPKGGKSIGSARFAQLTAESLYTF